MNSRQIRYFVAVTDAESFSGAAELLHVSQSAISARIGELEQLLQAKLFERGPRGVGLTAAGHRLLPHARAIMAAFEAAQRAMGTVQPTQPARIAIGVTPTIGSMLLPKILAQTSRMEPGLAWRVQQAATPQLLALLEAEELDVALCYGRAASPHVTEIAIARHNLALIGARAKLGETPGPITLAELAAYPLVLEPTSHGHRQLVDAAAHGLGIELDIRAEIEPLVARRVLVLQGEFCTVAPTHVFGPEIASGACVARRVVAPQIWLTLRLLLRKNLGSPLAGVVRTAIKAAVVDQLNGTRDQGISIKQAL